MRKITIDFTADNPVGGVANAGFVGEHNATTVEVVIPQEMMNEGHTYRLAVQPYGDTVAIRTDSLEITDGKVSIELPQSLTEKRSAELQLEEYDGDEFVKKSKVVTLLFNPSVSGETVGVDDSPSVLSEIAENTAERHTHANKEALDKLISTQGGGVAGTNATVTTGGAVGNGANATFGGAVGNTAKATTGGAVGNGAVAGAGFAGGYNAKAIDSRKNPIDAIQLGTGTNSTKKTVQFYDYTMMNADGKIPAERLTNAPTITAINLVKDEAGAIMSGTAALSNSTTVPITVTTATEGA